MKKALIIVGILFLALVVVPVVAVALGDAALNVVATVYAFAMVALPFILAVYLYKWYKRRKANAKAAPTVQARQQVGTPTSQPRQPVTVTKSTTVQPPADTHLMDYLTPDDLEDDIAYRYTNVGVFVPYVDVFDHPALVEGAIVSLRQEPENKHDSRAVAVVVGRKRIGYLYRGKLQDMANDWLDRGDAVSGRIVRVAPEEANAKRDGISINLYFYN